MTSADTPWVDDYEEEFTEELKPESSSRRRSSSSRMPPMEITTSENSSVTSQSLGTATSSNRYSRRSRRNRRDGSSSNNNDDESNKRRPARATRMRNQTADFVAASAPRISYDRDDVSCSGDSTMSMQSVLSTDTTSSIVTALLGSVAAPSHHKRISPPDETTDIMVVSDLRLAGLVRVLSSRERCDGIPKEYRQGNSLARRLKELFTFPLDKAPNWFWRPLFEGLMKGGATMNTMVAPPTGAQSMPLLMWLCQWKSLQKLFHWKGESDVVSMALAAGASPNVELNNGSTPIFFAVKYSCPQTVKLLVKYGAEMTIKDKKGRSCLWNALERPIPEVITYLLTEGNLPANEAFPYRRRQGRRKTAYQTAIDYLFAAQLSLSFDEASNPEYPWSWQVLGVPSEESVAMAMIEFGKRGATFSPNDITLQLISFVLRGDDPNRRRNRYPKYEEAKLRLQHLAHLMVGRWLPDPAKAAIGQQPSEHVSEKMLATEPAVLCSICEEDIKETGRSHTKLYCGHNFCMGCILSRTHDEATSIVDLTCPVCKRTLCLELTGSLSRRWECLTELYGDWDGCCHGPRALTTQQLRSECQARGITTLLRGDEKLKQILYNDAVLSGSKNGSNDQGEKSNTHGFDLNTNIPITDQMGNDPTTMLLAPNDGPVAIPIVVKGIPVTAYISTTSYFTLVAPEFVELFGLSSSGNSESPLGVSSRFKNVLGRATVQSTDDGVNGVPLRRLDNDFQFKLGGTIDISLRSVLVSPLPSCIGIQLGMDFLRSGAWCVIDAKLEGEMDQQEKSGSFVSTDGFGHVAYIKGRTRRVEELRYYARDGTMLKTPLLHLQPFQKGCMTTNWITVACGESFVECNWCCRVFPSEGMILHDGILTSSPSGEAQQEVPCYYCTGECREAAKDVRKARRDHTIA